MQSAIIALAEGASGLIAVVTCYLLSKIRVLNFSVPEKTDKRRIASIDGVRGFLALAVYYSHASSYHQWYQVGKWDWPSPHLLRFNGQFPVMTFFAITGFLFWGRALATGPTGFKQFYLKRILRIYPLYVVIVALTIGIAFLGFSPGPGDASISRTFFQLLLPGQIIFTQLHGLNLGLVIAQTWSLKYELAFYIILPILALTARNRGLNFCIYGIMLLPTICLAQHMTPSTVVAVQTFLVGMVAADIVKHDQNELLLSKSAACISVSAMISATLFHDSYNYASIILLGFFFTPIAAGNDIFGILSLRPCRLLGEITYSIYMIHLLMLFTVLTSVNHTLQVSGISESQYACIIVFLTPILIGLSVLSFKLFEEPFISGIKRHRTQT